MAQFTIGQLATQAHVNLQTLRYYEREGLLVPEHRTPAGYRTYRPDAVRRLRFIKRAQELGFSLREIKDLLSLRIDAHTTPADIRERAQAKLLDVDHKLRHLESIRATLLQLTADCSGCGPLGDCPILESLDGQGTL